jgi:transposase-like protein
MNKIQPSERISKEIEDILSNGTPEDEDLLSTLVRKSVKKLIQEVIEQEVQDYLGRGYFERNSASKRGYRNGYENKYLRTSEGKLPIEVPQLRDTDETYRSKFLSQISTRSGELERLIIEMYARGLSNRDIEDSLKDKDGNLLISKSGVSQVTESLALEYDRFCNRDLSGYDVVYLFLDGVYESIRLRSGAKEAILCAWAILSNGHKILLHMALGNKESYESWLDFFRNMIKRGLRMPLLVISDGSPGLIKAIGNCFPESRRQRCLVHKLRNIANKLPQNVLDEVMNKIRTVYYQSEKDIAMMYASKVIEEYASLYPSAIKCFQEDLENCLSHIDFPSGHHKFIRTTNLLERCFEEQKRRTKVIPRFLDESSCLKLIYATLIRVSEKWRRIKMSEYDLVLLKKLRDLYNWKDEDGFISKKVAA